MTVEDAHLLGVVLDLPLDAEALAAFAAQLEAVGGWAGLMKIGPDGLADTVAPDFVPPGRLPRLAALLRVFETVLAEAVLPAVIEDAADVATYFRARLLATEVETFWVLLLDARGRPLGHHQVAMGTLTSCLVHPREVFAPAIRARAAHVVLVHNHPSGDATPSPEDVSLTERLAEAGALLGIPVLDHVVVARGGYASIGGLPAVA